VGNYYDVKDWPAIDDELFKYLSDWSCDHRRSLAGIKSHPAFNFISTPRRLRNWVVKNLPIEIDEKWMVALQRLDTNKAPFHTDTIREWSYNCVIHGEGALTHFKDHMNGPTVQTVRYDKNKWYFHNGSLPHAVTGANRTRVAVTIFKFEPEVLGSLVATPLLVEAYRKNPYFYYDQCN